MNSRITSLLSSVSVLAVTAGLASAQCEGINDTFEGFGSGFQLATLSEWASSNSSNTTVEVGSGSNTTQVMLMNTTGGGITTRRQVPSNVSTFIDLSLDMKVVGSAELRLLCSSGGVLGGVRIDEINGIVRSFQNFNTTLPFNADFTTVDIFGEFGSNLTISYNGQVLDSYPWPASCPSVQFLEFQAVGAMGVDTDLEVDNICMSTPVLGTVYCTSNPNSTGVNTAISAAGSNSVAANDVTLTMSSMPNGSFGYFLTGRTQGFVPNPGGSQGNLCLGGAIGRYTGPGQISNSGSTGSINLTIDLTDMPQPMGPVAVMVGQTWNFQGWHRDSVGGNSTSNFSDALAITFQ